MLTSSSWAFALSSEYQVVSAEKADVKAQESRVSEDDGGNCGCSVVGSTEISQLTN